MLNLMRLEMKKFHIGSYIKRAIFANFVILAIMFMLLFITKIEGDAVFENYQTVLSLIDSTVRAVFIIFASALIAKLIISEFKYKTITLAFMYPINRKKLMASKLAIIVLFTFSAIIVSNVFVSVVFCTIISNLHLFSDTLTISLIIQRIPIVIMNAIAASCIALIPLYFGMRKYSIPVTIISSIFIVSVVSSNTGNFSLNDIIFIPIVLAIIGISVAYASFRKIEKMDI
ncbi:ABC transporter permease [Lysinibacillus pakistanensis]|uniref:ABC transporter permease n=1 Tax=Lysinibacillus pakistanensis TaxID=759811 RepID=A0AAX3WXA1_9BACI|nr:ABC transporter permease [Lysinibacillus pakistanensis]MDM5231353.1 ABC transporter permease [Lysinibacillus pakistanensis]WHY46901.1 ABC transporter permease [Lysinibacillus pakistanensis]WHY51914.1 ABC transporter permease [Lysinibacillus pakistanensis]